MPLRLSALFVSIALLLTACIPAEPLVSDFNGSSVKLQVSALADETEAREKTLAEAGRVCGRVGKRAEYASTRQLPDYYYEHLYLCL